MITGYFVNFNIAFTPYVKNKDTQPTFTIIELETGIEEDNS